MVRRVLMGCTISLFGRNPSWNLEQHKKVPGWLANLSGEMNSNFGPSTTHLVVSKKRWTEEPKPTVLQDALDEVANGRDLKIVTFDWLEDCLNSQSRKREAPYEWEKMDAAAAKVHAKNKKTAHKAEKSAAKSVPGIMSEVFHESTEQYVDPIEKQRLDRQMEREKEERRAREIEQKEEKVRRRREQAKIFGRGAKKARNHLLSENYHIYSDTTGFKYDVLVTKIDVRQNKNERFALTLYEENRDEPPFTYAMNAQFSGTSVATANNVIAAHGSTFVNAFHAFKSEFQRLTGMKWDERISAHIKRLRQEKLDRGVGTGSPAPGIMCGAPVSESAAREVSFQEKKFEYHPPGYGPKGEVTEEERGRLKTLGVTVTDGTTEGDGKEKSARAPVGVPIEEDIEPNTKKVVEEWIKGPSASAVPPPPPTAAAGQQQQPVEDVDFAAMMAEEGITYPFEKTVTADAKANAAPTENIERLGVSRVAIADQDYGDDEAREVVICDVPPPAAEKSAVGPSSGSEFDWDAIAADVAGDPAWLERELAGMRDPTQQQTQQQSGIDSQQQSPDGLSMQPEIPSFTTHPTVAHTSFQHGAQEIGETQVADRVGGEFLEELEFANGTSVDQGQTAMLTPPASANKIAGGNAGSTSSKGLLGSLNLGSSILGKRKVAPGSGSGDEGGGKKTKVQDSAKS